MKKFYFMLMLTAFCTLLLTNAKAQMKTGDWNIDIGPQVAAPIRNLYYFTSFGIGIDGAATTQIADNVNVGGRVNYSYFFGKSSLYTPNSISANIVNVLADGSYTLPYNVMVGVDLGLGFRFASGNPADTEFARIFNLGYKWEQSKEHTYIFTIYFDQTTYQKALGLRAAMRFK